MLHERAAEPDSRSAHKQAIRASTPVEGRAPNQGLNRLQREAGTNREILTNVEEGWVEEARRIVTACLRMRYGVPADEAGDAVEEATSQVSELLKRGAGLPYFTSVLMHVSRLSHAKLSGQTKQGLAQSRVPNSS